MLTYQTTALDSGHARPKKLPVRALWPLLLCMTLFSQAQDLSKQLFDAHDTYKDSAFTHRRFKHRDIVPVLQTLGSPLSVSQIGTSLEGRSIHQIQAGTGTISVLLWSQMHGDEATATMALFDIFRFLQASGMGSTRFGKPFWPTHRSISCPCSTPTEPNDFSDAPPPILT